jgi:ABC-type Fe3+/spermidine/putrescine transport system ATPase subunit
MSNLDYRVRLDLRHELRALQKRVGITAVYVTHDREEALTLADRVAVIDAGKVAQFGTPEEVFHHPASPFVAGFMGADNRLTLALRDDGALVSPAAAPAARRVHAHFRADAASVTDLPGETAAGVVSLPGVVTQVYYVGQGYRFRVRTADGEVWAHAGERRSEGSPAAVVVPRESLVVFPAPGP